MRKALVGLRCSGRLGLQPPQRSGARASTRDAATLLPCLEEIDEGEERKGHFFLPAELLFQEKFEKKGIFNIFCLVRGSLSSSANTLPGALRRGMQMFISLRGAAALHEPFEQLYGCKHSSDPLFL